MPIETISSPNPAALFFPPAIPRATSPIPVVCALFLLTCIGAYTIKTLCGRCRVRKVVACEPLFFAARNNWKSLDVTQRLNTVRTFKANVAQEEYYVAALPVAQAAIVSNHEQLRREGCALFRTLFSKDEGRLKAITAILKGRASAGTYQASSDSMIDLFPSMQELSRALQMHRKSIVEMLSPTERRLLGLKSFVVVVTVGDRASYSAALDAAEEALHASEASLREQAGLILAALFEKNFVRSRLRTLCASHALPELAPLRSLLAREQLPQSV